MLRKAKNHHQTQNSPISPEFGGTGATPNSVTHHTRTHRSHFPRRSRAPQHYITATDSRPTAGAGAALPLGGLEEGEVRREAEGGAHLAVSIPAAGRGILGRGAAARGGGVEDEVAGEAEQREEELVQHRGGLATPRRGVSLGFPRDGEEKSRRRKRAGTPELVGFPWILKKYGRVVHYFCCYNL